MNIMVMKRKIKWAIGKQGSFHIILRRYKKISFIGIDAFCSSFSCGPGNIIKWIDITIIVSISFDLLPF